MSALPPYPESPQPAQAPGPTSPAIAHVTLYRTLMHLLCSGFVACLSPSEGVSSGPKTQSGAQWALQVC